MLKDAKAYGDGSAKFIHTCDFCDMTPVRLYMMMLCGTVVQYVLVT